MAQGSEQTVQRDQILAKIQALDEADRKGVIKTRTRRAKIRKEYVGHTLGVFNGRDYTNVRITEDMVGRMLAKVAPRVRPTARATYLSIPPRKMRQVAGLIVGLPVEKALDVLNFTPKIAAVHMAKTLKSAVANKLSIEGTANLDPEVLKVSEVVVDPAPSAKRIEYRSMGRIYRLKKRFCHLAIYLDVDERKQRVIDAATEAKSGTKKTRKAAPKKKTSAKKKTTKKVAAKKTAAKKTTARKKAADKPTKSTKATTSKGKAGKDEKK
jgi:large subunit ribosomal protein L22